MHDGLLYAQSCARIYGEPYLGMSMNYLMVWQNYGHVWFSASDTAHWISLQAIALNNWSVLLQVLV